MCKTLKRRRLADAYTFAGFRPMERVQGIFGDPRARLITLVRRGKKRFAANAARRIGPGTTVAGVGCGICPVPIIASTSIWKCGGCRRCGAVKRERLEWLVDNALHTKRFALYVGRRCRSGTIKDVAAELNLNWQTVKRLEMDYRREQLRRVGTPGPKVIGIDEISIRKRHTYRIVVSDLERHRPIWFGGADRSEASMDQFYRFLGEKKAKRVRLAVMDMWKAFRNSTRHHAPNAAILFDKFHVIQHLGKALDQIRKLEYARLEGKQRRFIKGQKYTLLSHPQNLSGTARKNLKLLLAANKRLNIAYVLKESFGQLWDYNREAWARKFFENWRAQLKWQRLKPYEDFAAMIERHWNGIAAYCKPENKVALGFVEGLNNKIRVLQRRAYGLRDEEYLRLKILTSMLPQL